MAMTKARRDKKNSYDLLKKQTQKQQLPKLRKEVLKLLNDKIKAQPDTLPGGIIKDDCLKLLYKINNEDDLSFKQLLKIKKEVEK